jgi:hypothetical protein
MEAIPLENLLLWTLFRNARYRRDSAYGVRYTVCKLARALQALLTFSRMSSGCGPDEGVATFVVMIDVVFNRGNQFDDIAEDSTASQVAKEASDHEALVGVKWM